jgi:hypothetical protein
MKICSILIFISWSSVMTIGLFIFSGQPTQYSTEWKKKFFSASLKPVGYINELPKEIQTIYNPRPETRGTRMANPGEPFNPSDVIRAGDTTRRMIAAGVGQHQAYVWYEQGGIGLYFVLDLFEINTTGKFSLVAHCTTNFPPREAILDGLRSHLDKFSCETPRK